MVKLQILDIGYSYMPLMNVLCMRHESAMNALRMHYNAVNVKYYQIFIVPEVSE